MKYFVPVGIGYSVCFFDSNLDEELLFIISFFALAGFTRLFRVLEDAKFVTLPDRTFKNCFDYNFLSVSYSEVIAVI